MNWLKHRWEKDHRYYEVLLTEDLFGWVLLKSWGRKGTSRGRTMRVRPESYERGRGMFEAVKKRRKYRGYNLVT
jgi:hypothetical protein